MDIVKKNGQWGAYSFGTGFLGPVSEEDMIRSWIMCKNDRFILNFAKQGLAGAVLALDVLEKVGGDFCEYVMDLIDDAYN
jgi:hypothetical protein